MGKFTFLVFDGICFGDYKVIESQIDTLLKDIENALGRPNGCTDLTSPWMNRFVVFKNDGKSFIIVPSTIPSYNDVVKATVGKYVVLLTRGGLNFQTFELDDIQYFMDNILKQFDNNAREEKYKKKRQDFARCAIRDTFRIPLCLCSDDTVEIMRYMLLNGYNKLFRTLAKAAVNNKINVVQAIFELLNRNSDIKGITISRDEFADEAITFFTPEVQFECIGVSPEEGLNVYYSLTIDGYWMRDAFLAISEKKIRDMFKDFIRKFDEDNRC